MSRVSTFINLFIVCLFAASPDLSAQNSTNSTTDPAQLIKDVMPLVDIAVPYVQPQITPTVLRVDSRGDIYMAWAAPKPQDLTGWTTIGPEPAAYEGTLMVAKLNATLDQVLYKTIIQATRSPQLKDMQVDAQGNVYLTGFTFANDFPATARLKPDTTIGGFVLKLNPDGSELVWSTLLGNTVQPQGIAVRPDGVVAVGGFAQPDELTVTREPIQVTVEPFASALSATLLELSPNGMTVNFASYFDPGPDGNQEKIDHVVIRPNGDLVAVSDYWLFGLTADASQVTFATPASYGSSGITLDDSGNIYLSLQGIQKFDPAGNLLFHKETSAVPGPVPVAPDGTIYGGGDGYWPDFPTRNTMHPCLANFPPPLGPQRPAAGGGGALVHMASDGTTLFAGWTPLSFLHVALSPDGRFLYGAGYYGDFWGLVRLDLTKIPTQDRVSAACISHGAAVEFDALSPGAIMTLFGSSLGPQDGVSFTLENDLVPTELSGTTLTVDGDPAPVLYTDASQVNFIVPWSLNVGQPVEVCVQRNQEKSCLWALTTDYVPKPFHYLDGPQQGQPIIVNQDGTLNSRTNPAARGDVVSLYLTGGGLLSGTLQDGAVSGLDLQYVQAPVSAGFETPGDFCQANLPCYGTPVPADVLYAGSAPTLVSGVIQVNLRIPQTGLDVFFIQWGEPTRARVNAQVNLRE